MKNLEPEHHQPDYWHDRLERAKEQQLNGDIFQVDELRTLLHSTPEDLSSRTVPAAEYLKLMELLIQSTDKGHSILALPIDLVETMVNLTEPSIPEGEVLAFPAELNKTDINSTTDLSQTA